MVDLTPEQVEELLPICKYGQPREQAAAWDTLASYLLPIMRRLAESQLARRDPRHRDRSEDIAMDTWISLQLNIRKIEDYVHLLAWLRTTTRNGVISFLRLAFLRRELLSDDITDAETYEMRVKDARLLAAIRKLSPQTQKCLFLRYWLDMSLQDIADREGIPVGTVKSRLWNAHRALAYPLAGITSRR